MIAYKNRAKQGFPPIEQTPDPSTSPSPSGGGIRAEAWALPTSCGFTLIELLVVVSIIAILLALLTPALDKAMYTTEMTLCMANERAVVQGGLAYTGDYKRRYPYRAHVYNTQTSSYGVFNMNLGTGPGTDDRVIFRGYIAVNKSLNCPLNKKLDYEGSQPGTLCYSDYAMWMGMQYGGGEKGMFKLGDRFTWNDPHNATRKLSSNALVSSFAQINLTAGHYADHPDNDNLWSENNEQDKPDTVSGNTRTWSAYWAGGKPYVFNLNFAMEDNSVVRINSITPSSREDDGVKWAWSWTNPTSGNMTPLPAD